MGQPVTASLDLAFAVGQIPLDGASQLAGLAAATRLGIAIQDTDVFFHRVLLPANAEFNLGGTLGGVDDAFRFDQFPALENTITGDPVLDLQGLPLTFATLRLIVLDIQPIRPFQQSFATAILASNGTNVAATNTVTIDGKVYTYVTALTPTEGQVLRGATADASQLNLIRAINHTGTPGTDYSVALAHPTVLAAPTVTAGTITITARTPGPAANTIPLAVSATPLSWSSPTLEGGAEIATPPVPRTFDGHVNIELTGSLLPDAPLTGSTLTLSAAQPHMIALGGAPWVPAAGGNILVHWETDLSAPATAANTNAYVTLLLIGTSS
jgi:hypothetical protein